MSPVHFGVTLLNTHAFVLQIDSEETAYNAVIRWVYYDEPNRSVHLPNLLSYVRLAIMSVRFLTDVVDNEVSGRRKRP